MITEAYCNNSSTASNLHYAFMKFTSKVNDNFVKSLKKKTSDIAQRGLDHTSRRAPPPFSIESSLEIITKLNLNPAKTDQMYRHITLFSKYIYI